MLPLLERGDVGTDRPILIDGIELSVMPAEMEIIPEPVSEYLDMFDGGAREFQRRPYFDGIPNYSDRYTFVIPYDALRGEDRVKVELIRARGGIHRLTVWRMVPVVWTCVAGVSRYYLPRFRKPAAHLYAGTAITGVGGAGAATVTTNAFPIEATLGGVALDVTYAEGPTLADPGAGGIVFARMPDVDGEAADYTALRIGGALVTGTELVAWGAWSHEVSLRAPRVAIRGLVESHALTFVEV